MFQISLLKAYPCNIFQSGSSPLISMARDVEVTPNPLSTMLRDGSTVILTKAPTSDLEKNMAK